MPKKMKNGRKKAKSSSSSFESKYLPPEIWTQILATVPAKTLLKFRCVCKSWRSIIDNPDFVHLHFHLCNQAQWNNNKKLLVALERLGSDGNNGWLLTLRHAETLRKKGGIISKYHIYSCHTLGSCNGLLLVEKHGPSRLRLWNPSICKSLVLPASPLPHSYYGPRYLFGFAPKSLDYKVVEIAFDENQGIEPKNIYYAVYTLRDQQWTVRKDPLNVANLYHTSHTVVPFHALRTALFFRGTAYWLAQNDFGQSHNRMHSLTHLGSFDFDTENVTFLELPFSLDEAAGFLRFLFFLGGSLAVFSISEVTSSIWVLEQDNEKRPWTQWFSGQSSRDGYQLFDVVCLVKKIFYFERDGGYFIYKNKAYNITTCQVRELNKSISSDNLDLAEYSESLVLSKGYGAHDSRDVQ